MLWCCNFILFSIECKDRISTNSKIMNIQISLRWSFDCWLKIWWKMTGAIGCNDSMLQSLESFRCWNYWTTASVRQVWKQTQKKGTALALCKRAGASPPLSSFFCCLLSNWLGWCSCFVASTSKTFLSFGACCRYSQLLHSFCTRISTNIQRIFWGIFGRWLVMVPIISS